MLFPSVHLILVCKSKCPKIMDTYQGEWGHCTFVIHNTCFPSWVYFTFLEAFNIYLIWLVLFINPKLQYLLSPCFSFINSAKLTLCFRLGPWNLLKDSTLSNLKVKLAAFLCTALMDFPLKHGIDKFWTSVASAWYLQGQSLFHR